MKSVTGMAVLLSGLVLARPFSGCAEERASAHERRPVRSVQVAAAGDGMVVAWVNGAGAGLCAYGSDGVERWRRDGRADLLAADDAFIYIITAGREGSAALSRLRRPDGAAAPFEREDGETPARIELGEIVGRDRFGRPTGMAAHKGVIVVTFENDLLAWIDGHTGRLLKDMTVPIPAFPAYGSNGDLYAMIRGFSHRVEQETARSSLLPLVAGAEVGGLAVDGTGGLVVLDPGPDAGVRVFCSKGVVSRRIGTGAPAAMPHFPPTGNHRPAPGRIAVDGKGQIWVASEPDREPALTVWSAEGERVKEFSPLPGGD